MLEKDKKATTGELTPYRKIARKALVEFWIVDSEVEAKKKVETLTNDQLEKSSSKKGDYGIGAKSSINSAIRKKSELLSLTPEEEKELENAVYGLLFDKDGNVVEHIYLTPKHVETLKKIAEKAKTLEDKNEFVLDTLFAVHNNWVITNPKKFLDPTRKPRRFQHLPSELIGWAEAKKDLVFIIPIAEAIGINVSEKDLEKAYNARVKAFFKQEGIKTKEDLVEYIKSNKYGYLTQGVNTVRSDEEAIEIAEVVMENLAPVFEKSKQSKSDEKIC